MATHAPDTLRILGDSVTAGEKEILGCFAYQDNEVVVHRDASFMPKRRKAWSSWNFLGYHDDLILAHCHNAMLLLFQVPSSGQRRGAQRWCQHRSFGVCHLLGKQPAKHSHGRRYLLLAPFVRLCSTEPDRSSDSCDAKPAAPRTGRAGGIPTVHGASCAVGQLGPRVAAPR